MGIIRVHVFNRMNLLNCYDSEGSLLHCKELECALEYSLVATIPNRSHLHISLKILEEYRQLYSHDRRNKIYILGYNLGVGEDNSGFIRYNKKSFVFTFNPESNKFQVRENKVRFIFDSCRK